MASNIEKEWTTQAGLVARCLKSRHRCGYVAVPVGHPLYGVRYSDDDGRRSLEQVIDCHGGLTFSDTHDHIDKKDTRWWFGFECAHADDILNPKSLAFVERECESLAEQIVEMSKAT